MRSLTARATRTREVVGWYASFLCFSVMLTAPCYVLVFYPRTGLCTITGTAIIRVRGGKCLHTPTGERHYGYDVVYNVTIVAPRPGTVSMLEPYTANGAARQLHGCLSAAMVRQLPDLRGTVAGCCSSWPYNQWWVDSKRYSPDGQWVDAPICIDHPVVHVIFIFHLIGAALIVMLCVGMPSIRALFGVA